MEPARPVIGRRDSFLDAMLCLHQEDLENFILTYRVSLLTVLIETESVLNSSLLLNVASENTAPGYSQE